MDQVAQVREKIDIVALLSEYIPVKKAGRNFKANCPFHGEKTPSFVISPERQIWHCFGCGKGGDAYTFLMEYEHMDFPEALRFLAKRVGIEIKQSVGQSGIASKKEQIFSVNKLACEFYHFVLTKHPAGKHALSYLREKRRVSDETIKTFLLGFAPPQGTALTDYLLKKKKYPTDLLTEAGLITFRGGRPVDFFANRLIFSLIDHRDNVVGFSGRILIDNPSQPKYINTRETLVYHKGSAFFGLNIAKKEIKKEESVIVTEGEFDVISSFQEGIGNTIAVKGSGLTEQQVSLIARFAKRVILAFDTDSAGEMAIKRSLPFLERKELLTMVVVPNGKDVDEAIKSDPYAYKKALKHAENVYDFLLAKALVDFNNKIPEGKKEISEALLPLYNSIGNEIVKEHYLKKLAEAIETTYESILKQVDKQKEQKDDTIVSLAKLEKKSREEMLEEYLVSLILQAESPTKALDQAVGILSATLGNERTYQKILHHLLTYIKEHNEFHHDNFGRALPTELISAYDRSFLYPVPHFPDVGKYDAEVKKIALDLQTIYVRGKINVLSSKIKEESREIDDEDAPELQLLQEEMESLRSLLKHE